MNFDPNLNFLSSPMNENDFFSDFSLGTDSFSMDFGNSTLGNAAQPQHLQQQAQHQSGVVPFAPFGGGGGGGGDSHMQQVMTPHQPSHNQKSHQQQAHHHQQSQSHKSDAHLQSHQSSKQEDSPHEHDSSHYDSHQTHSSDEKPKKKSTRPQKKRKIQSRVKKACLACRRSHVGCDAIRPCKRCLKKGIPCIDSDSHEASVAFAFNNTLPLKRKSEKEPELLNDGETSPVSTHTAATDVPIHHNAASSPHSATIPSASSMQNTSLVPRADYCVDTQEFKQLKNVIQRQQQMLTLLMSQMQIQSQELNDLKSRFEMQPRIHNTLFHSVPVGPWNNFSDSKDNGVFVFRNDESQQLLGFNTAMAHWKQIDELSLKTGGWTWWKMSEKKVLPKSIMCLVKSGHRSLYFNFKVLTQEMRTTEVRVSIHVDESVWWITIDFSLCGSTPHRVKCLPQQTCPLKKERIEKECKDNHEDFQESMDILLGSKQDE